MNDEFEVVRGSGNVFRDLDLPHPELSQLRAILAAQIVKAMDRRELTPTRAETLTGVAAAEFSRLRHAKLRRFTVDRLMTILDKLDEQVTVTVESRPRQPARRTAHS